MTIARRWREARRTKRQERYPGFSQLADQVAAWRRQMGYKGNKATELRDR